MASTADLLDTHGARALVCSSPLRQFGGVAAFEGAIATVRCDEDNVLVKRRLSELGAGRVLVVDGGGSLGVAIVGDTIAGLALANGWSGLVLNACVRDVAALRELAIGIKALGSNPRPSRKEGAGEVDVPVEFGGVTFHPGGMLHSDDDGVVVLEP
jgi:regulator of ribonuclease activity A